MLLRCVHGGYIWLDRLVSIDTDLIVCITSLPWQDKNPTLFFFYKKNENTLYDIMKEKFHIRPDGKVCDTILIL
jgi:hypothetical protein